MAGERADDRRVLRISGADRIGFLQGLVTNDMRKLAHGPVYAALLTPQGKYLADFLLIEDDESVLLDVHADLADGLARRLTMYRLRADVQIAPTDLKVSRGLGTPPPGAVCDPRHAALGWRLYGPDAGGDPQTDWDGIRVANCIPETGIELHPEATFILEAGFERLAGVDHRKGCYVGQEVTARMKHKTELRKGLVTVSVEGDAAPGTEITDGTRPVGTLHTRAGDRAIAYLRFDRAGEGMRAGDATVRWADAETLA
ncbi:YgfZ/GcvT domain-containing protein [Rhodobaculum claviforme]|uniref:Folate-binding protein YgfZ n=1 Tax=Rhodobaculum claviforme TaxID=1549854 RepID=A0A934TMW8_9RHOB|nr:folate-binding protein YgfZ [Rhodobaculum claviforme]MBK5928494.1 folate-binding protein YgfZ [Rhodobaculum claviforme]